VLWAQGRCGQIGVLHAQSDTKPMQAHQAARWSWRKPVAREDVSL